MLLKTMIVKQISAYTNLRRFVLYRGKEKIHCEIELIIY